MHTHIVFFWLWKSINDDERALFEQELKLLISDSNACDSRMGKPAKAPYRNVVDPSYDYGIVVRFENLAAHDNYQSGQTHQRFLEKCAYMWSHVKVYDIDEV